LPWWSRGCYLAAVVAATIFAAYAIRSRAYFYAAVGMLVASLGRVLHIGSLELERVAQWEGARYYVLGLVCLGLGVSISSAKAGIGKHLTRLIPRPLTEKTQSGDVGT
jgi:hypothetical protein